VSSGLFPGGSSTSGFLAEGERLEDVVERDRQTLRSLGVTHEQVADRLELVLGRAERRADLVQRGRIVPPWLPWLEVESRAYLGFQSCPFDGSKQPWAHMDFVLRDHERGLAIALPGLLPHLVREHAFFEGSVQYRTDPARLVDLLRIHEGDETPTWRTECRWLFRFGGGGRPWFYVGSPRSYFDKISFGKDVPARWNEERSFPTARAYRAGDLCVVVTHGGPPAVVELDGAELELSATKGTTGYERFALRYVAMPDEG
jgi:hypothetical protein